LCCKEHLDGTSGFDSPASKVINYLQHQNCKEMYRCWELHDKEGKYKRSKPNAYVAKAAPLKLPKHDATSDEKSNESNKVEHAVEIEKKKTAKKV
jgi:hypothetical protein